MDGQIAELKTALVENQNQRQAIREDSAQFLTKLTEKMDRKKDRKLKYEAAISQHIDKFGENDADAFDSTIDEFKGGVFHSFIFFIFCRCCLFEFVWSLG